jgi:hypothetical protein
MAAKTISATRRRNVTPTSSILRIVTRDVDCSAFPVAPEDGQFVITAGDTAGTGFSDWANGTPYVFSDATANNVTAEDAIGSSIKMVWSSALQTDRQALGNTKVPVLFLGGVEVECQLLNADDSLALNHANYYPAGTLVTVKKASSSVQGTANRLVINPLASGHYGWAVGYVTKTTSDTAADGKSVTIMLYDQPRKVGNF